MNYDYGARPHRDSNNAGVSLTRSMGNFTGGALQYWPDDDARYPIEALTADSAVTLDTKTSFCLFDGKRYHGVQDFEGERYSLVFFSVTSFADVPEECRKSLPEFPTEASLATYQRMLAPPKGFENQMSIQEAFGLPAQLPALSWPANRKDTTDSDADPSSEQGIC